MIRGRHPGGRRGLRRPAASVPPAVKTPEEKWKAGEVVAGHRLPPTVFREGDLLIFEKSYYFGAMVKVSGELRKVELQGGETHLLMKLNGAQSDGLLTWATGSSSKVIRVHLCRPGCNQAEVAEDLVHGIEVRLTDDLNQENGWASNLQTGEAERDDLADLRERARHLEAEGVPPPGVPPVAPGPEAEKAPGGDPKDKKKGKKKKKKKKDKKSSSMSSSSSSEGNLLSGKRPRSANVKELSQLFGGTGLDPVESTRKKVSRRAKRYLRKKSRSSSSSEESSLGKDGSKMKMASTGEGLFEEASKVRLVAEKFPGTLGCQAITANEDPSPQRNRSRRRGWKS